MLRLSGAAKGVPDWPPWANHGGTNPAAVSVTHIVTGSQNGYLGGS